MHKNLVYDIEHFDDCDKEAQKEIRHMMKKYNKFPLDYIELYFDEYDVFDMYEDDPEAVYDEHMTSVHNDTCQRQYLP